MSAVATCDLRSNAKSYQRDKNHNAKWRKGARAPAGKRCLHDLCFASMHTGGSCAQCAARPHSAPSKVANRAIKRWGQNGSAKRSVTHTVLDTTSGVSDTSEDEIVDPSAATATEIDIMYSFDAQTSLDAGNDILSNAVIQAVKKFENKQTEQLIKNEYDLVPDGKDEVDYIGDVDDDFELVEYAHVN